MKIALFLPNWLGDLVMATPALRAVRKHFHSARVVGIMRPNLSGLLAGTAWIDEPWYCDPRAKDRELRRWTLVRRMRQQRFDLAILFPNSLHSALLAWAGGARKRIGYARDGRRLLLTRAVPAPRVDGQLDMGPMVDYYLGLAEAAGCPAESRQLELHVTPAEEQLADQAFQRLGLRGERRLVVFNAGSAYGESKSWPVTAFGELARRIVDLLDHDVLVICGPAEKSLARAIVRSSQRPRVVSLADQPIGLGLSKAAIARCRFMVTTDSGPRHVAAALGKPVITLFGPTPPIITANPTVQGVDLQVKLDCVPCRQRTCPLGHHRCMRELSVDAVFAEVASLAQKERTPAAA
jgi:heptosyltransferase-2